MIEWLEEYFLRKISRFYGYARPLFFERVCNEILELEDGTYIFVQRKLQLLPSKKEERLENEAGEIAKAKQLYNKNWNGCAANPKRGLQKVKAELMIFYEIKNAPENAEKTIRCNGNQHGTIWAPK